MRAVNPDVLELEDPGKSVNNDQHSSSVHITTQVFAAFAAALGGLGVGTVLGYSSPAGAQLVANSPPHSNGYNDMWMTTMELSWFSSSSNLGAALGCLGTGVIMATLGKRHTMLGAVPLFILGWIIIGVGGRFWVLLCGRVLTGMSMGVVSTAAPPFIAEITSPHIRGAMGGLFQVMLTVGILFSFGVGANVSWRWLAGGCTLSPLLHLLTLSFTWDSPAYLLARGRTKEAQEALQYYRGKECDISVELATLQEDQQEAKELRTLTKLLKKPHVLKPLYITLALMFFQQFSGIPAIFFNMVTIFKESGVGLSEHASAVVVSVVQMLATIVACFLIDRTGRRLLLILSSSFMMISIVSLGVYFYLRNPEGEMSGSSLEWLPLTALIVFVAAFSIGLGPVPWVVMGELFSPDVKEVAAGLAVAFNWITGFISTLLFLPLRNWLGDAGIYWVFGVINLAALVFSVVLVPETKGKTLHLISQHFQTPKPNRKNLAGHDNIVCDTNDVL